MIRCPSIHAGHYIAKGFENNVSNTSVAQNGTFFNNMEIMRALDTVQEQSCRQEQTSRIWIAPRHRMPRLDTMNMDARGRMYLDVDADLVNVSTVIGTSEDQIAIAPGSLRREWRKNGRRYFSIHWTMHLRTSIRSCRRRYEVAREKWNGIDLEVYYIPKHAYNVPNMLKSPRKSLEILYPPTMVRIITSSAGSLSFHGIRALPRHSPYHAVH
ncbi:MAG: hypothetical protein IPH49_14710 [Ignavibacteria bacterium]|nr:hypothetical protein [Ignavibacteria bacterium]